MVVTSSAAFLEEFQSSISTVETSLSLVYALNMENMV